MDFMTPRARLPSNRLGHQRRAPRFRHEREYGTFAIGRVLRKIDSRGNAFQDAPRKYADFQMRRLHRALRSGNAPRLDRLELALAVLICHLAPESEKPRIGWFGLRIRWMIVFSERVCLPDFDQRIRDAFAVAIQHRADEFHALALNIRRRNQTHAARVRNRD